MQNPNGSLDLKKFMTNNADDYVDHTENIRELKHSVQIRDSIRKIEQLKKSEFLLRKTDMEQFIELCRSECRFLYDHYTDIFNKIVQDEIDLRIMTKLLMVLKMIEDGKVDQHDGSVMVGKILKELYVDSALKRSEKLDKEYAQEKEAPFEGKKISWKQYKMTQL